MRHHAKHCALHRYGARCEVYAAERIVMLKTLHCQVRVVWVYRTIQMGGASHHASRLERRADL